MRASWLTLSPLAQDVDVMTDLERADLIARQRHDLGRDEMTVRQALDVGRDRGAEEEPLPFLGQRL
jgi:hypothetical protein